MKTATISPTPTMILQGKQEAAREARARKEYPVSVMFGRKSFEQLDIVTRSQLELVAVEGALQAGAALLYAATRKPLGVALPFKATTAIWRERERKCATNVRAFVSAISDEYWEVIHGRMAELQRLEEES